MRRSTMVSLTMLPMLATAAVAAAQPARMGPPGEAPPMEVELAPPGMTPHIWELDCEEDPNWELRRDCPLSERVEQVGYNGGTVLRGGFGNYFHLSGGSSGGTKMGRGSGGS